jgi:acyl carrier protein
MDINIFKSLLEGMGIEIEELKLEQVLGDELEMDSQEIVELTCEIEEQHNLSLKDGEITRNSTIQEVLDLIAQKKSPFDYRRTDTVILPTTASNFSDALWKLEHWEELLPHIKKIEVLYDDGANQEFYMTVDTDGNPVKVRSIRRLRENVIEFFQPVPPKYLKHHGGCWILKQLENGMTKGTLVHNWNISEEGAKEFFPNVPLEQLPKAIEDKLFEHAQASLRLWKNIFSKEVVSS